MSAPVVLRCAGAPRDLGFDQGTSQILAIRRETHRAGGFFARWRAGRDPRVRTVARDVARFFPHMAERAAGLARGAGVSRADLARLLARELGAGLETSRRVGAGVLIGVTGERSGGAALIARSCELPPGAGVVERQSTPEHDYRSREWVLPWLVPPIAGVNQHGLAAAVTSTARADVAPDACQAPAALLVQDCLQRFDRVDRAVEWCERRPAGGQASLLLADVTGDLALVTIEGARRQVSRPAQGLCVVSDRPEPCPKLEKAALAQAHCDATTLRTLLGPTTLILEAKSGDGVD